MNRTTNTTSGMIRRLAARLNRNSIMARNPEKYIELAGGRCIGPLDHSHPIRLYLFEKGNTAELLWEIDGGFKTTSDILKFI